jgi:hypothetical protein
MLSVVAVALALAAGGQAQQKDGESTRKKSDNKGKIEGTRWVSRAATLKSGQEVPAGALEIEFKADGGLFIMIGPSTAGGTFTLGEGDKVTLNLDKKIGGYDTLSERVTIEGDVMTMIDPDGTKFVLDRKKK